MLDIKMIERDPAGTAEALAKRGGPGAAEIDGLLASYNSYKSSKRMFEDLRAAQKKRNEEIAGMDKKGKEFKVNREEMKVIASQVKEAEKDAVERKETYEQELYSFPNIPEEDVPPGGKEANKIIKEPADLPEFAFEIKDHLSLSAELGILDFDRASKISGAHFPMYVGDGALLEWALISYFIKRHTADGYTMYLLPHLLNRQSAFVSGQLPKFEDDVYWTRDGMCLLPTAETGLANLYRDEIIDEKDLPKKLFAYSPCYRKESGAHGVRDRGLMRMHQFDKVEMFQYSTHEHSGNAHEELIERAESLVQELGLVYRVSLLAGEDMSFGMAKTVDVEAWLPYEKKWSEVSSISNARDFQARRGNIRYRTADGSLEYVHMLNASGLATSRLMVALLETYQQKDGSIKVPEVLQDFMGKKVITAK